eukprot:gene5425-biopygen11729
MRVTDAAPMSAARGWRCGQLGAWAQTDAPHSTIQEADADSRRSTSIQEAPVFSQGLAPSGKLVWALRRRPRDLVPSTLALLRGSATKQLGNYVGYRTNTYLSALVGKVVPVHKNPRFGQQGPASAIRGLPRGCMERFCCLAFQRYTAVQSNPVENQPAVAK